MQLWEAVLVVTREKMVQTDNLPGVLLLGGIRALTIHSNSLCKNVACCIWKGLKKLRHSTLFKHDAFALLHCQSSKAGQQFRAKVRIPA